MTATMDTTTERALGAELSDAALVDYWNERACDWRAVRAHRLVCGECGATYADMVWVETIPGEPHIECPCGEQFSLTVNRDR